MWVNLAEAEGVEPAKETRDKIVRLMTPAQIAEAQRQTSVWKPVK